MRSKHVLHCFSKFTDAEITNVVNQISGLSNFREFRITLWATKAFVRFMNWTFAHRTIVLGFHHNHPFLSITKEFASDIRVL